ncbi:MAG: BrnT family toxin [Candidatus Micrarchaeaceae archaeon]
MGTSHVGKRHLLHPRGRKRRRAYLPRRWGGQIADQRINSCPLNEKRFYIQSRSNAGRHLYIVYTIRGTAIRVLSARDMSRRERREYYEAFEGNS